MAMVRLAAVLEDLHEKSSDPSIGDEAGIAAARELGATVLRHFDLIVTALRDVGGK